MEDRSRRRARLVLIVGLLFAVGAGATTFFVANTAKSEAPAPIPTSTVVVAAREIPAKTQITTADIKLVRMNTDAVPPSAYTSGEAVVGQITLAPISIGEPVLPSRLAGENGTPFVVIPSDQLGPTGAPNPGSQHYRAMSITVADAQAAGGNILAGDIVDVLFSFKFDPSLLLRNPNPTVNNADVSARIVLERVPILARNLTVYTIRTDAATAERIGWMTASGGQLQLLLRGPRDDRATGTSGATFSRVYPDWRIPVPEKITP